MFPCQATYFVLLRTFNVLTSYVQRVYFVRSTCLLRTFNGIFRAFNGIFRAFKYLFRPFKLSYFGRSTCLLRPFNVLTSAVQRVYFGRSTCLLRPFNVLTSAVQRFSSCVQRLSSYVQRFSSAVQRFSSCVQRFSSCVQCTYIKAVSLSTKLTAFSISVLFYLYNNESTPLPFPYITLKKL